MIKRLIIDIDDTLIDWDIEYDSIVVPKVLEELNMEYDPRYADDVTNAIAKYEEYYEYYKIENMLDIIKKELNKDLPHNAVDVYLENVLEYATPDELPKQYIEILEYLSQKYELVALTNWFRDIQEERLKKVGINKYFKEVFGAENFKAKPNIESFNTARGDKEFSECVMIGDSFEKDVMGAINVGMKAIWVNKRGKQIDFENENIIEINKIEELREIL